MRKNDICLKGKCGSCRHYKQIDDTCNGECLKNPYSEDVFHDPKHPHWIVPRSRKGCPLYFAKKRGGGVVTNFERIKAMSVEEMAKFLAIESVRPAASFFQEKNEFEEFFNRVFSARKEWLEREVIEKGCGE